MTVLCGDKLKKLAAALISLSLVLLSGCIRSEDKVEKLNILASFYPIYIMALNITDGVEGVNLQCMAREQTGCLHDFKLSTEDMRSIEKADSFIINGAGMEGFISDVVGRVDGLNIIDSSVGIELLASGHNHNDDKHEGHDHDENEYNSHLWVSVANCITQVENITEGIIRLDPKNETKYRDNSNRYIEKLRNLKNKMEESLADISNRDIITFHEAFDYFAEEFDLNIVSVIEREPGSEPNARDLADIIDLVNETGVHALFVEPQYPETAADVIAAETDAQVYTLDPGVSGDMDKDAYIDIMNNNLKVLKNALS